MCKCECEWFVSAKLLTCQWCIPTVPLLVVDHRNATILIAEEMVLKNGWIYILIGHLRNMILEGNV